MKRVDADGHDNNLYSNGDPQQSIAPTLLRAQEMNAIQEEICNSIEGFGVTLDQNDDEQLKKILKENINTRYFKTLALANGASVDFTHDFKTSFSELSFNLYLLNTGTGEHTLITETSTPNLSQFSLVAKVGNETTQVTLTNSSGSSRDLVLVCYKETVLSGDVTINKFGKSTLTPKVSTNTDILTVTNQNYTVLDNDWYRHILVSTGAVDRYITLPTASANTDRVLSIKKIDSGVGRVIVDGEGSETIDGAFDFVLNKNFEKVTIVCDGTQWLVLEGNFASATTSGIVTTEAQTFAGTKTFNNTISGSINGNAATVTNGVYTNTSQDITGSKKFLTNPIVLSYVAGAYNYTGFNRIQTTAAINNDSVAAWLARTREGAVCGNFTITGFFYIYAKGGSSSNSSSYVYSVTSTGNGGANLSLTQHSVSFRGTNPIAAFSLLSDPAGSGACRLIATFINNSGVVNGGEITVVFEGLIDGL